MSAISEKITNDAVSLPVESWLELVGLPLQSLNIPTKPEIDELWIKEAECRIYEIDSGSVQSIDGEAVFDKLRKRLQK